MANFYTDNEDIKFHLCQKEIENEQQRKNHGKDRCPERAQLHGSPAI